MKIETKPRDDHQVTLTVELEPDRLVSAKRRAARRISERKSIPGFRPGKAPYEMVIRHIGEAAVTEEAIDLLLDEVYPETLKEAKIEPAAPGTLDNVDGLEEKPKFTFTVPLAPTIDLANYRAVRLAYDWKEPGQDKVDDAIEELRQMYGKTETVTRPAEKGDFVMIDLVGVKTGAAEGEAPAIDRPGMPVFIRPEVREDEWPFEGFSHELIGVGLDQTKTFRHKFPKAHADETLQGETINFEARVKMVRGTSLPGLNDEFARQVGPFSDLEALRQAVKANLAAQSKSEYDDDYFTQLVDKIREGAKVHYPPQVVAREVEHVLEDLQSRLTEQNMDLETYFKMRETTREKFIEEEARPVAVRRLERTLIMEELIRQEKIELSDDVLSTSFQHTWGEFTSSKEFAQVMRGKSRPPKRLIDAVAMQSANQAITDLTLTRLKEIATGQAKDPAKKEPGEKKAGATKKTAAAKQPAGGSTAKKPAPRTTGKAQPTSTSAAKKPAAPGAAKTPPGVKAKKPAAKKMED
ncbi:MAG: trigger factor [Anaerolineales bacterium]|nr:trigger factor [Anaerolineales bacterium]